MNTEKDYITLARDNDFLNAYLEAVKANYYAGKRTSEICEMVANSSAPRYYVSAEEALHQYNVFKKTGFVEVKQESSVRMYLELFKKFEDVLSSARGEMTKIDAMTYAINTPASCFFLKPSFARVYIYRVMRRRRNRRK